MASKLNCPLCDWALESTDDLDARNAEAAPWVAAAMGMPADALLSIHRQRELDLREREIRTHMAKHGPEEWLPALMEARNGRAPAHIELRENEDGTLDEIVALGATVHLEQMSDQNWFLSIETSSAGVDLSIGAARATVRATITERTGGAR